MRLTEVKCPKCGKENNKKYVHLDLPDDYDMFHDIEQENQSTGFITFVCSQCGTNFKAIFVYDFVKTELE